MSELISIRTQSSVLFRSTSGDHISSLSLPPTNSCKQLDAPAVTQSATKKRGFLFGVLKFMSGLRDDGRGPGSMRPEREDFAEYFDRWLAGLDRLLQLLLVAVAKEDDQVYRPPARIGGDDGASQRREENLRSLVKLVMGHYEDYFRVKKASARLEVVPMFDPHWLSSSEKMFMWVGGWRPTMAIQLLYSTSGLQLQNRLEDILRGIYAADLAGLTPNQMSRINEVHRRTVDRERRISEDAAEAQETVVCREVVELSHVLTERNMHRRDGGVQKERDEGLWWRMEAEMATRKEMMAKVLESADTLRLETLRALTEILNPLQAVHFLAAGAEVHLLVHYWGKMVDGAGSDRD